MKNNYAILVLGISVTCLAVASLLDTSGPSAAKTQQDPYVELDPSAEVTTDVYLRASELAEADDESRVELEKAMADRKLTNGEFETVSLRFIDRQAAIQHKVAKEKLWQELVARGAKQSSVD